MSELDLRLEDGPHARMADPQDPIDILAAGFERRRNKQLALDSIASVPLNAWSTCDLVAERKRARAILDQAPPDRSADLAALVEARREVETKLRELRLSIAKLECRKRPRKERRLPDVDLLTGKHNLAHFEQQADRLDREIAALHTSQHRRASHLAAHGVHKVEIDAIGDVLHERAGQQTTRVVQDPPSYITKAIGPRPSERAKDRAWVRAVVEIEKYRFEHDITDGRTLIGPSPTRQADVVDWYAARNVIAEARAVIYPATPCIDRPLPTFSGPSLDIGL
jgi:hypothetical protein